MKLSCPTGTQPPFAAPLPTVQFGNAHSSKVDSPVQSPDLFRAGSKTPAKAAPLLRFQGEAASSIPQEVTALGERYKKFLHDSPDEMFTAKTIIEEAKKRGFREFPGFLTKTVHEGDKFYINNGYRSVALVVVGKRSPITAGFNVVAAHTDSPHLKLKRPNAVTESGGVARLKTEVHGGGVWGHWFNRALGLAATVYDQVTDGKGNVVPGAYKPRFLRLDSPALVIPDRPIHFDHKINDARPIKPENDLTPTAAVTAGADESGAAEQARRILAEKGLDLNQAHRANISLFPSTPPQDSGVDGSQVLGAGQDDRSSCFAAMDALFEAAKNGPPEATSMALFFDNEETGSLGRGGARAPFLEKIADQLLQAFSLGPRPSFAVQEALAKSTIFSADAAHGWLPQQAQYHDNDNHAQLGQGPVVKWNSDGNYATTAEGAALTEDLAKRAGIPLQFISTNQDVSCGTTIGPLLETQTGATTIDIGAPLYSMHSPGEVTAKADIFNLKRLFSEFFRTHAKPEGR